MNKAIIGGFIGFIILIIIIMMWPTNSKSSSTKGTNAIEKKEGEAPNGQPILKVTPFITRDEFYNEWQKYISGGIADQERIKATAALHHDWTDLIFPEKYSDFHDGIRLAAGHYRILYPFLSASILTNYGILRNEIMANNIKSVKELIDQGANANTYDAITSAHTVEMIDFLVKHGSNPNQLSESGSYPIEFFKKFGRPDLIQAMIRNGARGGD